MISAHSVWRVVLLAVLEPFFTCLGGTMGTAKDLFVRFDSVANDPAVAVTADGGERLDGALEAVKSVRLATEGDGEGFVVNVAAGFAGGSGVHGGDLGS